MNKITAFSFLLFISTIHLAKAIEVKDLAPPMVPVSNLPINNLVSKKVVGTCDGTQFTDQAAYEGCQKNYFARYPKLFVPIGNSKGMSVPPLHTDPTGN